MAKVTASELVEKHANNLKSSTQYIRQGVERVKEAPTKKAAAAIDRMRTNLNAAIDSGKWERGLNAVSKEDWQDSMINKGIGRIAAGVDAAKAKNVAVFEKVLRDVDTAASEVAQMPKGTLQDSINRAAHYMTRMSELSKR